MPTLVSSNSFYNITESQNALVNLVATNVIIHTYSTSLFDLHCLLSTSALCSSFSTVMPNFRLRYYHYAELSSIFLLLQKPGPKRKYRITDQNVLS